MWRRESIVSMQRTLACGMTNRWNGSIFLIGREKLARVGEIYHLWDYSSDL